MLTDMFLNRISLFLHLFLYILAMCALAGYFAEDLRGIGELKEHSLGAVEGKLPCIFAFVPAYASAVSFAVISLYQFYS